MIRRLERRQNGFTVFEMIVACAVAGIVIIGVMTFMTNTIVNNSISTARADLLREAQLTLDALTREARLSSGVDELNRWEDANSPDAAATNGYGWTAGEDVLILATAAQNSDRDILFQDATNYISYKDNNIYFVQDGVLMLRTLAADVAGNRSLTSCPANLASAACPADRELINDVASFSVRYLDGEDNEVAPSLGRSIEITLNLSTEKYGRQVEAEYVTRTVFRNE